LEKQFFDYKRPAAVEDFRNPETLVEGIRKRPATDHSPQIEAVPAEYERKLKARRWKRRLGALGLGFLGVAVTVPSCILSAFSPVGSYAALLGVLMLLGSGFLFATNPRGSDVNHAVIFALRHGGALTVMRLALEMDISTEKAEKIINELVKKGLAEIDLASSGNDGAIVYRLTGL
jgi:hypothetical protein